MIPYDDLVVALTAWRARQGLPVTAMPVAAPVARTAPPAAPRPAEVSEDELVEEAAYDAGDDYVVPLGGESTAIGVAPEAPKRW